MLINEAFDASSEDIITDYNDSYGLLHVAFDRINNPFLHLWSKNRQQSLLSTLSSLDHWGIHFAGLNPISLVGLSGWPGEGRYPKHTIGHWGSPGLGSWTPPLLHIHYITGSHHTGTWLLLPFLCWWHTALSLISTRWSNGSCMDLRLLGGHLGMDERKPSTLTWQDWASCLPATPTLSMT